jgi:elongation factor G
VLSLAIEPLSSEQEKKLLEALDKLLQEDPTLRLEEDPETGQRLLWGMGELHLQIAFERLEREFNVSVKFGKPVVALRETVTNTAGADHLFERMFEPEHKAAVAMKAWVRVAVAPRRRKGGVRIMIDPVIRPAGAELSVSQREAIEASVGDVLAGGPVTGAPMEDLEVRVAEVELFGADSTPQALHVATAQAARKAFAGAGGRSLHPIMTTEVVVPTDNLGAVLGDLQARQAVIRSTDTAGDAATISCDVALDQLLGYTTDLRSMTQGRGQFSMIFDRFDVV